MWNRNICSSTIRTNIFVFDYTIRNIRNINVWPKYDIVQLQCYKIINARFPLLRFHDRVSPTQHISMQSRGLACDDAPPPSRI